MGSEDKPTKLGSLEASWRRRTSLNQDEACELADAYLLSCELIPGAPIIGAEGVTEEVRLQRAQWLVLWGLLRARDEAMGDDPA